MRIIHVIVLYLLAGTYSSNFIITKVCEQNNRENDRETGSERWQWKCLENDAISLKLAQ